MTRFRGGTSEMAHAARKEIDRKTANKIDLSRVCEDWDLGLGTQGLGILGFVFPFWKLGCIYISKHYFIWMHQKNTLIL